MSLSEKMYEDLKGVIKRIIIVGIIVFLLWTGYVAEGMKWHWEHGMHFRCILLTISGIIPFYFISFFVVKFYRYRELRWGHLVAALVFVFITVSLLLSGMKMTGH